MLRLVVPHTFAGFRPFLILIRIQPVSEPKGCFFLILRGVAIRSEKALFQEFPAFGEDPSF